jgi:hypothetical protein
MRYATPAALRHAIDDRLRTSAGVVTEPMRLRRRIAFERLLRRVEAASPGHYVLKGGMALEARYPDRARTTKDLDLAQRGGPEAGDALQRRLVEELIADPDGDWFVFEVGEPAALAIDDAGRRGWRLTIRASLDGRLFATVHADIVGRRDEAPVTERIVLPNTLAFAGVPDVEVAAIDLAHHFAEKLHAFTRDYGGRSNTRVKDLTDLVLLIEVGLAPSTRVRAAVERVFGARATHALPTGLPSPPASWEATFATQAAEVGVAARDLQTAVAVVDDFWSSALRA